jgi:hypothetical protein
MDKGAVTVRPDGTFAVDPVKAKEAVTGVYDGRFARRRSEPFARPLIDRASPCPAFLA